ncbi:MAG TPA: hypothetical protein VH370_05550 [Humisphaera sp.]|jgi:hypothetical protein|nr:hypothetical protein [Humisphaera sp.]
MTTAFAESPSRLALPAVLRAPLDQIVRRRRKVAFGMTALSTVSVALLILLVSAALIGFMLPPFWLRLPIAVLFWVGVIYMAARFARPLFERWTLARAARHVERLFPQLQERLSSAVELTCDEPNTIFRGSPDLLDHLVQQASEHVGVIQPRVIIPTKPIWHRLWLVCFALFGWVVLTTNSFTAAPMLRGAYATFLPWKTHFPASIAMLAVMPGDITIGQGDSLEISAKVPSGSASLLRRFAGGRNLSEPMNAAGAGVVQAMLENVQQSFSYRVQSSEGESEWYAVTVHPRPTVARLTLHYDFPPYTQLGATDAASDDGAINALAGTSVAMRLDTAEPIDRAQSTVVIDPDGRDPHTIRLTETGRAQYEGRFTIQHSGDYRIRLLNSYGLANRDDQPRPITARFDQVPSIVITSPTSTVTVRPDDSVPVTYLAADDFGLAAVDAIVSIDDAADQVIHLPRPPDAHSIKGVWPIELTQILAVTGAKSANKLAYQLRATDNRDPDPQTGLSSRQTIIFDSNQARSYADQLNDERKRRLEDEIRKAIERLRQADWRSNNLKNADDRHVLTADERRDAVDLRQLLVSTSRDLASAAGEFFGTPFDGVARAARDIAEHPIADAAADVAKMEFAADAPAQRQQQAGAAHEQIVIAARELEKLIAQSEQAQRKAESAEALRQAARKQQQAAEGMTDHPQLQDENLRAQHQAIDKLSDAMNKDPSLRDEQARDMAKKLTDLAQGIEDDATQQEKLRQQAAGRQSPAAENQAAQKQIELARKTEQLRSAAEQLGERAKQDRDAELTNRAQAAEKSLQQARDAQQRAADAQAAKEKDKAQEEQKNAQAALNQADQSLRDSAGANEKQSSEGTSSAAAQKPDGSNAKEGEGQSSQGNAGENSRATADAAQEAAAAQRQALRPNPAAAREAAKALSRAAAAAARALQSGKDSGQSSGQQSDAQAGAQNGTDAANAEKSESATGQANGSRAGIRGEATGASNTPPAAVLDLGISAGDWARLPPMMQQNLLTASQQTGPPAYREMIRNYYIRVAKMQSDGRVER